MTDTVLISEQGTQLNDFLLWLNLIIAQLSEEFKSLFCRNLTSFLICGNCQNNGKIGDFIKFISEKSVNIWQNDESCLASKLI